MNMKTAAGILVTTFLLLVGSAGAEAQTITGQANISNSVGSTISEDFSGTSCSPSGTISAPSISNNSNGTATGSSTNSSMTCFFRYQNATGALGCQFEVQVTSTGGLALANAYKGSGGRPTCTAGTGTFNPTTKTFSAPFTMQ